MLKTIRIIMMKMRTMIMIIKETLVKLRIILMEKVIVITTMILIKSSAG